MNVDLKFLIVLLVFVVVNVAAVSASDINSTDSFELPQNDTPVSVDDVNVDEDALTQDLVSDNTTNAEEPIKKTTPIIKVKSKNVKSKDTLEFSLKNKTGSPIKYKKLTVMLNKHKYTIKTNSKGIAKLNINLPAKKYKVTVSVNEGKKYNSKSISFTIKVSKLKTRILPLTNFVIKKNYLRFYVYDQKWNPVDYKKVILKFKGKTYYRKTNKNGALKFKVNSPKSKYSIHVKFKGDNKYKKSSKTLKFYVISSKHLKLQNFKLLTKGYLRVYLKDSGSVFKKTIKLNIGKKKLSKKTNSEGIAVFKPKVKEGIYKATVKMGKYRVWKKINCYEGKTKDPLKESVPLKDGRPDIDLMPGNYVSGDESATYTLTKAQYREVLKRDSYCLFLNNKLTKYTFFKTKSHPKLNHIIKREKWNVIEREINKKLVSANKHGYWPGKITVSLKGKSYIYPEVRDVQNTAYTCGPTSCSVCSQVLKNYLCEKYLTKISGTNWENGTTCTGMLRALEKNHFNCTMFYKSTFKDALNELKKGGASLVFHADRHYVTIIDISSDGKKVLVSNSYGSYDNIPTKWLSVGYMKKKFSHWEESLIVKLSYKLSKSKKASINNYYISFGKNWHKHSVHQTIGRV